MRKQNNSLIKDNAYSNKPLPGQAKMLIYYFDKSPNLLWRKFININKNID